MPAMQAARQSASPAASSNIDVTSLTTSGFKQFANPVGSASCETRLGKG